MSRFSKNTGHHGSLQKRFSRRVTVTERELSYHFYLHQHPFVQALTQKLIKGGSSELQAADTEDNSKLYLEFFEQYSPTTLVKKPYPVKELDFSANGAYAIYNWELFFHVPFTIAVHLSKNQRFAEAQHWFHYLFDPTDDSDDPLPERFWKVHPFREINVKKLEEIFINLTRTQGDESFDKELRDNTLSSIEAWKDAPFRPHTIAGYRPQAYMYKTVMAYLDNLIAWGDSLFRQDTGEAIDEALMLYVLASSILGPRPQPIPSKGTVGQQTYANLREKLQEFGTERSALETEPPFDSMPSFTSTSSNPEQLAMAQNLGRALFFCMPRNDKLLGYWDTVADRLFKIRNSLNFQGVFRQLALFEPPIDPAMLARAAAAGLDVGAIVNGVNQPLPLVRFAFLVQKAAEIAQEVKSLGNNLLSAMEKEDGETMALLRAKHERIVMEMVEHVKYGQLQEAIKSKEGLLQSFALAVQRYTYYEQQLGKKPEEIEQAIPAPADLDKDSFNKMKLSLKEPTVALRTINIDTVFEGGNILSPREVHEMSLLDSAQFFQHSAATSDILSSALSAIPKTRIEGAPWGIGVSVEFGGMDFHNVFGSLSSMFRTIAGHMSFSASKTSKIETYFRREQEWAFQSNLAAGEINQIRKQISAAQIREAIAEQELKSHRQQMRHAQEIEQFLNAEGTDKTGKKTNKALYTWMKREVKGLYSQCFQFAFDTARKAERALQHELGNSELSYLQFGYLAGKEGLLAGEKLYLDIKRMEMAYHEQNQREYELTKHVSLLQIDPLALIQLRMTGSCTVQLPEALFDMDGPGHYFRRIKTVAISIPCVTGPYSSINCTLTLLKSTVRKTPAIADQYPRADAEDSRFSDYFGSLQSIVTSSAQNDSGLFETNLRDERYLPFENSGVISEWKLQLPADPSKGEPAQFDYNTISDVILHIRYTARQGGELLRSGAIENLKTLREEAKSPESVRLFAIRHEFPSEWAKFITQKAVNDQYELSLVFRPEHYPFWSQGHLNDVTQIGIFARSQNEIKVNKKALAKDAKFGNLLIGEVNGVLNKPDGELKLSFDTNVISDLWIAVTWS